MLLPLELYRQIAPGLRGFGVGGTLLCFALTLWTLRHLGMKKTPALLWGAGILFATAVPWPSTLEDQVVQGLMQWTAMAAAEILNWIGVLAVPKGNLVELESGVVGVNEACSGVRSLQSCLMASVALGQIFRLNFKRSLFLTATGQVLAIAGNLLRSLILTWIAATRGIPALDRFHDPAGWTVLAGVTLLLFFIATKWEGSPIPPPSKAFPPLDWTRLPQTNTALIIALIAVIGARAWYFGNEHIHPAQFTQSLALNPSTKLEISELPVPSRILDELQPQTGAYYNIRPPELGEAAVYYFFWSPDSQNRTAFFHRPDICMPGAGWEPTQEVRELSIPLGGRRTRWYLFHFKQGKKRIMQAWGVWRDGDGQILDFEGGWKKLWGQQIQRWHFIRQGKRKTNTEIAAVAVNADQVDEKKLIQLIQQLFEFKP